MDYYGRMTRFTHPFAAVVFAIAWIACALFPAGASAQDAPSGKSGLTSSLFYELLVAELKAQSGDSGEAFQWFMDAARQSNTPALYERAMGVALRARAGDSALEAAQAWAHAFPTAPEPHRFVLQILIGLNRLPDSIDTLKRQLAALSPANRIPVIDELPSHYARASDKKAATKALEAALAPELGNAISGPSAYAAIGTLRVIADEPAGALEAARKGLALNPSARQPVQLALGLIDPLFPDAEALVLRYLKNTPSPEVRMGYIRRLLEIQRYAEAKVQIMGLTSTDPTYADGWLVRGSLEMEDPASAAAASTSLQKYVALKRASELQAQPANSTANDGLDSVDDNAEQPQAVTERGLVQAYILLAQLAAQHQQYDLAQSYLDQIHSPTDALRINTLRATILAKQGQLEAGLDLIRGSPENDADDARAKISAEADLLRDSKQYQAEYDLLNTALQDAPDDPDLQYDLAMAADRLNRPDEMESLLRQVIATKPDYPHAYNALGYSLADRNIRLDEARSLISKALELAPSDPYIVDSLGWVEFRRGNLQEALKILRNAFQSRRDPEIAAHLGEVLWTLKEPNQAREVWNQGLAVNPDNETLRETLKRLNAL